MSSLYLHISSRGRVGPNTFTITTALYCSLWMNAHEDECTTCYNQQSIMTQPKFLLLGWNHGPSLLQVCRSRFSFFGCPLSGYPVLLVPSLGEGRLKTKMGGDCSLSLLLRGVRPGGGEVESGMSRIPVRLRESGGVERMSSLRFFNETVL